MAKKTNETGAANWKRLFTLLVSDIFGGIEAPGFEF